MLRVSLAHSASGDALGKGQIRSARSTLVESNLVPSGLKLRLVTIDVWPTREAPSWVFVSTSHNRIVPSALPVASIRPSGLNTVAVTTESTGTGSPTGCEVRMSHRRNVFGVFSDAP